MKILITGSSGHLGEALVRTLEATDNEVIGIDILPSPFTHKVGSIADRDFVAKCMQGVEAVIHTATLHKPHVVTHSRQQFIDTNITGTLNLLEEAVAAGAGCFLFTSTTSTFGDALTPAPDQPAVWITEDIVPVPKNIYGATKTAAEDLCRLFHRNHGLPCLILRTSRFFPEEDDNRAVRQFFEDENAKANEYLYRRADVEDMVSAHLCGVDKAAEIGFGKYIISATTPFTRDDLTLLNKDARQVVRNIYPDFEDAYVRKNWKMFAKIGRVYVNEKARRELGWQPKYDFQHVLDCLKSGNDFRSPMTGLLGKKGYHAEVFEDGPFPT